MNLIDLHHPTTARSMWRMAAVGFTGVAMLAACGDDDDSGTAATTDATDGNSTVAPTAAGSTATTVARGAYDPPPTSNAPATTAAETATTTAATPGATPGGAASVATTETDIGTVLVNAEGMTLYAFLNDTAGESTCFDACADAWPPALVDGEPAVGDLDATVFSVVEHPQGQQLKAGDWPLYTFAGDAAPGDVNGQGSGGVWFAVTPDGELVE